MRLKNRGRCALMIGSVIIPSGQVRDIDDSTFRALKETRAGCWYLEHRLEVSENPPVQVKENKKKENKKGAENTIKQGVSEDLDIGF